MLGAPGSGKGTQGIVVARASRCSARVERRVASPRRSPVEVRSVGGSSVAFARGELVPDDLVLAVVGDALDRRGRGRGICPRRNSANSCPGGAGIRTRQAGGSGCRRGHLPRCSRRCGPRASGRTRRNWPRRRHGTNSDRAAPSDIPRRHPTAARLLPGAGNPHDDRRRATRSRGEQRDLPRLSLRNDDLSASGARLVCGLIEASGLVS